MTEMILDVEERPTIRIGDTLAIEPDMGDIYEAKVSDIQQDKHVTVRIPSPYGTQTRKFYKDELEEWRVIGVLLINPDNMF